LVEQEADAPRQRALKAWLAQREALEAAKRATAQAEAERLAAEQAQQEARVAHEEAKAAAKRDQMMEAKRLKKAANEAAKHIRLKRQAAAVAERLRVEHAEAAERQRVSLAPHSSLSGNNNLYPSLPRSGVRSPERLNNAGRLPKTHHQY
jgi:membrane protein involved in colicin uptake